MSFFNENKITAKGLILLAKGQTGEPIVYTRIVLGDGHLSEGEDVITDVINPKHEIGITKCIVEDNKAVIGGPLVLIDIEDGFYYRELGLYANDPEEGEILYSYGNSGNYAEWIAKEEGVITERFIELISIIDNAANVTAIIDSNMFATLEDIEANRYIHPDSHPASIIKQDKEHRFVTDEEKDAWTRGNTKELYGSSRVILSSSAWINSQQIITISSDMLTDSLIWFSLDESATIVQIQEYEKCGLWASYNGIDTGQLAITAIKNIPAMNLPIRVMWSKGDLS